jgi:iron complex outermembrane receptor protein
MSFFDPKSVMGEDQNVTGTTVVKGIEAQAQGSFGGWTFNFGTSYLNSNIGKFVALDVRNPGLGFQNLTGRALPNAPMWTVQAGAQYTFNLGDGQTLTPRIDYGLDSARWATVFQVQPFDRLAAQNLFNAEVMYDPAPDWRVTLYATNLFDLHYVSTQLLGNLGFPGAPRQVGIRLNKTF